MLQAPKFESLSFRPFSLQQDCLATSEVDVGWREIVEALVIANPPLWTDEIERETPSCVAVRTSGRCDRVGRRQRALPIFACVRRRLPCRLPSASRCGAGCSGAFPLVWLAIGAIVLSGFAMLIEVGMARAPLAWHAWPEPGCS